MSMKGFLAGALSGGALVIMTVLGYAAFTGQQSPVQAAPVETAAIHTGTRAIFESIHPACRSYKRVQVIGGAWESATCALDGTTARIDLYATSSDLEDMLKESTGRGMYGHQLVVVAGKTWTISFPAGTNTSRLADVVAEAAGGQVVFR